MESPLMAQYLELRRQAVPRGMREELGNRVVDEMVKDINPVRMSTGPVETDHREIPDDPHWPTTPDALSETDTDEATA